MYHRADHRDDLGRFHGGTPEKDLFAAVINRAIDDLRSWDGSLSNDAYKWITCHEYGRGSFYWFMEQLDKEQLIPEVRRKSAVLIKDMALRLQQKVESGEPYDMRKDNQCRGKESNMFRINK